MLARRRGAEPRGRATRSRRRCSRRGAATHDPTDAAAAVRAVRRASCSASPRADLLGIVDVDAGRDVR